MIQAHKALDSAARACSDGGTIVLLAECEDGTGRDDFIDWLDANDSRTLAAKLCEKYQVNGQTAWSLLQKAEQHRIAIVTAIDEKDTKKMRLQKVGVSYISEFGRGFGPKGYIMPNGAKTSVEITN
jgi:nickel-dependent lactate racemase